MQLVRMESEPPDDSSLLKQSADDFIHRLSGLRLDHTVVPLISCFSRQIESLYLEDYITNEEYTYAKTALSIVIGAYDEAVRQAIGGGFVFMPIRLDERLEYSMRYGDILE